MKEGYSDIIKFDVYAEKEVYLDEFERQLKEYAEELALIMGVELN